MTDSEFSNQLNSLLTAKMDWYNSSELPKILDQYRLLYTCVNNIYDLLIQKSLITEDPYRLDKKISDVVAPDSSEFPESEKGRVLGTRLSDYTTMLDFVCMYTRFSVETITLQKIKKLSDLNNTFLWNDLTTTSPKPNTRAIAEVLGEARMNSPSLHVSVINDNLAKCSQCLIQINSELAKLTQFQRELYKGNLRKDLFEHPSFNKEKAFSSPDAEMAEIKRIYPDVMGKKPFYTELINEIITEDQSPHKDSFRSAVLDKLQITETVTKRKKKQIDPRDLLISSLDSMGAFAPVYQALLNKISDNFALLHDVPGSFLSSIVSALKKAFNVTPKDSEYTISITDPVSKTKTTQKIKRNEFLFDLKKKQRIYTDIATKSGEYSKILAASDQAILGYVGKQINENQKIFTIMLSLDEYFKKAVPSANKAQIKGLRIDLESLKNAIISVNKKKGEYQSLVEEVEQMKKLGIVNDQS